MRRTAILGTTAALAFGASALVSAPATAVPEGGGVDYVGHVCGTDAGPGGSCTTRSTTKWRYGGIGPFTIVAKHADGTVAWRKACATGAHCESVSAVIPARKKVTVKVTGPTGSVVFGSAP